MARYFFLICLLLATPLASQEIYTWIDKNGIRHISDTPASSGSTTRTLPDIPPTNSNVPSPSEQNKESYPQPKSPLSINVISPTHGETIRDNTGALSIKIELNRELATDERLQMVMDNQPIGAPSTKKVWQLKNVERGAHSFLIQLVVSGKVIASSSTVTVYLHQASVN